MPQKLNGHTWHRARPNRTQLGDDQEVHDPWSTRLFETTCAPRTNFDTVPFLDTRITHVYAITADPTAQTIPRSFPGADRPRWRRHPVLDADQWTTPQARDNTLLASSKRGSRYLVLIGNPLAGDLIWGDER